ncbi:MAG TPA: hypothetical protein P5081_24225 [Phycisphaerae bacterium]|nr:hypothetical protein [Phycisphaerae bacterium]HRW55994.1 hypothetical protein [Phycisphaerae bacterium]
MKVGTNSLLEQLSPFRILLRRRPERMPPALWRQFIEGHSRDQRIFDVCVVGAVAGSVLWALRVMRLIPPRLLGLPMDVITLVILLALVVMTFVFTRVRRRIVAGFVERLAEADARVCLECGYSLVGAGESHVCPECGDSFDPAATRRIWMKMFPELAKRLESDTLR